MVLILWIILGLLIKLTHGFREEGKDLYSIILFFLIIIEFFGFLIKKLRV